MAEYLELEKVLDDRNIITVQTKEYGSIDVIPVDTITDVPLADAQPVKRGCWVISNIYARCSECSVAYDLDTFQRLIPMHENVPRHCSYCGARMDGDAE